MVNYLEGVECTDVGRVCDDCLLLTSVYATTPNIAIMMPTRFLESTDFYTYIYIHICNCRLLFGSERGKKRFRKREVALFLFSLYKKVK